MTNPKARVVLMSGDENLLIEVAEQKDDDFDTRASSMQILPKKQLKKLSAEAVPSAQKGEGMKINVQYS